MKAMVLHQPGRPLVLEDKPLPQPGPGELLLKVLACGVCRTDLHICDGELDKARLPLVIGHEIVAEVESSGPDTSGFRVGQRVGVPWLGGTDKSCKYCATGRENLCDAPTFTGYTRDGGYAEHVVARADFTFPLPGGLSDEQIAPLLCAGLIGWRSYKMTGEAEKIGFYGFGAAAHILIQVARHQGRQVYAFTKPGDDAAMKFARGLGAVWAGGSDQPPPQPLDAAIIFAPVGSLVTTALKAVDKGGVVVCGGIHMSDIPSFPYEILWEERVVRSVANLTRDDAREFLALAPEAGIKTSVRSYPLDKANEALDDLRQGRLEGAAVLVP